jgi:predicted O-methyltransferase YrrM
LLRSGGALAILHALGADTLADPAQRDAVTTALRGVMARVSDDPDWSPVILPVGDGILVAVRNREAESTQSD